MFSNVKVGDKLVIDSYVNFCTGGIEEVTKIDTRFNSKTGKPYKVIVTDSGKYRASNGMSIKRSPYYISGIMK